MAQRWNRFKSFGILGGTTIGLYAPGFSLMAHLSDKEKKALRMGEADLGGPASSVPCVATGASIEQLNQIISKKGLPYLFVDAEGPEEGRPWN